jgi:hypothetical protein
VLAIWLIPGDRFPQLTCGDHRAPRRPTRGNSIGSAVISKVKDSRAFDPLGVLLTDTKERQVES